MNVHNIATGVMRALACLVFMVCSLIFCGSNRVCAQAERPSHENTTYCYDFESDGLYFRVLNDQCVAVTAERITKDEKGLRTYYNVLLQQQLTVPGTVAHADTIYKVVAVDQGAFAGLALTDVELPPSVLTIGSEAFAGCHSLVKVSLPDKLQAIGDSAFANCSSLAAIRFPKGVEHIGRYAFAGCAKLQKISIEKGNTHFAVKGGAIYDASLRVLLSSPAAKGTVAVPGDVEKIGEGAFAGCAALQSVALPQSVKEIGEGAFLNSGLRNISLPRGLTTVAPYTFANTRLSGLVLPMGIVEIEQSAFEGSTIGSISLPNSLLRIGEHAFRKTFLKSVGFPDALSDIGMGAFENCPLYAISFGNGLVSIGPRAFQDAPVVQLELPAKLMYIGEDAFAGCSRLLDIHMLATTPPMIEQDNFATNAYFGIKEGYEITLHVPQNAATAYKAAPGWKNFQTLLQSER